MKKVLVGICLILCSVNLFGGSSINVLSKVEAATDADNYVSHVAFEFLKPLHYEKEEVKAGEKIELYFPGIQLSDFEKLEALKSKLVDEIPAIKNIAIDFRDKNVPVPGVVVSIDFVKELVVLLLTKIREPNLLVIDIFNKRTLEKIEARPTTHFMTCNKSLSIKKKENFRLKKLILL